MSWEGYTETRLGGTKEQIRKYLIGKSPYNSVKFAPNILACEEDAEKYLNEHWTKYESRAVQYRQSDTDKDSKAMLALYEKRQAAIDARRDYVAKNHVADRKSEYIGCPKCGSKMKREYFKRMYSKDSCFVCGQELRSETVMNNIKAKDEKIKKIEEQILELKRKESEKNDLCWAVQYDIYLG